LIEFLKKRKCSSLFLITIYLVVACSGCYIKPRETVLYKNFAQYLTQNPMDIDFSNIYFIPIVAPDGKDLIGRDGQKIVGGFVLEDRVIVTVIANPTPIGKLKKELEKLMKNKKSSY
jgi:hypothetical protein